MKTHPLIPLLLSGTLSLALLSLSLPRQANAAATLLAELTANDAAPDDQYGYDVAVDGSRVVIGAYLTDQAATDSGSAYVYDCTTSGCTLITEITGTDTASNDAFGWSVAVSGSLVLVGAHQHDGYGNDAGAAYLFTCSTTSCTQVDKLTDTSVAPGDFFGHAVALDGTTAVIGAFKHDVPLSGVGAAYVYECGTLPCTLVDKLSPSDPASSDQFGIAVDVSGSTVVVGANANDDAGSFSGSAYVFSCGASSCGQTDKLTASDAAGGDVFGSAVGISGGTVVVSAFRDDGAGTDAGSIYLFDCTTLGACIQRSEVTGSSTSGNDWFGYSVDIDGTRVISGAIFDNGYGSATLFDCTDLTACTQTDLFTGSTPAASDQFGLAVAVSGGWALVGAPLDDVTATDQGSAALYSEASSGITMSLTDASGRRYFGCGRSAIAANGICYFPTAITGRTLGETYTYTVIITQQGGRITHSFQDSWAYNGSGGPDEFYLGVYRHDDLNIVNGPMDLANPQTVEFTIKDEAGTCYRSVYGFLRTNKGLAGNINPIDENTPAADCSGGVLDASQY